MSLLDTASLIVTPNGYKEGKLYSVIPSDGSGDLSVTRATTATRVNSSGLVELVPYNLFQYSSSFSTSPWGLIDATLTGGQSGYDGTTNAFLLNENNANSVHLVGQVPLVTGQHTISVYAKANSRNWIWLRGVQSAINVRAWFNLSTGTVGTVNPNGTANIESVGNGWYRCELTIANHQSGFEFYIGVSNADNVESYTGNGSSIYIQDAQLVEGSVAKDYQKTETRLNIPRLDYSNGTCPSILVEPQRTNICRDSNNLSGGSWLNQSSNTTLTRIQSGGPDGNAFDRLVVGGASGSSQGRFVQFIGGISPITNAIYSVYLKGSGQTSISIFNGTGVDGSTINLTNEWTRYEVLSTSGSGNYVDWQINLKGGATIDIAFHQVELATYRTSYIPTTSASVTRNADVISKTGISSLIGQTEGTIFLDFVLKNPLSATNRIISITEPIWSDGSIRLDIATSGFTADITDNGANSASITYSTTPTQNTRYKVAIAYKANDFKMYINGIDAGSDTTTGGIPTCSQLHLNALGGGFNAPYEASNINSTALWKTRLTNAQLATLTTI